MEIQSRTGFISRAVFCYSLGGTMLQDGTYSVRIWHIIGALLLFVIVAVGLVQMVMR
jgi:hypothetical protein